MGFNNIAGVDEVGRGPLIGPVVTACVVLPHNFKLEGLTDSKKLSEKKDYDTYFNFMGYDLFSRSIILDTEIEHLYILSSGSIWRATSSRTIKKVF